MDRISDRGSIPLISMKRPGMLRKSVFPVFCDTNLILFQYGFLSHKPVPQTGDDYNLYIWIGVLGAAVIGSGFMLAREIGQYKESADTYVGLSEYVTPAETDGEKENAEAPDGSAAL